MRISDLSSYVCSSDLLTDVLTIVNLVKASIQHRSEIIRHSPFLSAMRRWRAYSFFVGVNGCWQDGARSFSCATWLAFGLRIGVVVPRLRRYREIGRANV